MTADQWLAGAGGWGRVTLKQLYGNLGRGDGIDLYLGCCGEANSMYLSKLRTAQ